MKKLDFVEEFTIRLTEEDKKVLTILMEKYDFKSKSKTIRQSMLDAMLYLSLIEEPSKPTLPPEKKIEKPILPPPGFSQQAPPTPPGAKSNKDKYNYFINQGLSPAEALAAVQNGK